MTIDNTIQPTGEPAFGQQPVTPLYAQPTVPVAYGAPVLVQAPSNGLGVAGFVTGLLGLLFSWVPVLGIILALLGVVMGGVGIASGKKKGAGIGLAVSGLVLGIIALIPAIIVASALASVGASL